MRESRGRHHFFPNRSFKETLSIGQQPFQSRVFVLQRLQPLGFRELGLPFVHTGVADVVLAAKIGYRHAGLVLLQNPDDLLFRKATVLCALVLKRARANFKLD